VQWKGPAYQAGLVPGMKIVSVDGDDFTADALKAAIRQAKSGASPITLTVKYVGTYRTLKIDYHDGLKYPHLVRVSGTPDYLGDIARAKGG
jgi:predicted metalloprotease with PDZ domain